MVDKVGGLEGDRLIGGGWVSLRESFFTKYYITLLIAYQS